LCLQADRQGCKHCEQEDCQNFIHVFEVASF
jgi:hypothetical protein